MFQTFEPQTKKEINYLELLLYFIKKWYIIVSVVLVSMITCIICLSTVTPLYDSTAKLYVIKKDAENITPSDLSISMYLSNDFAEIILDTPILTKVSEDLNGKYSTAELKKFTSLSIPANTRILEIQASSPNANDSKRIVDSICNIAVEELPEIMGLDNIKIIREGTVAKLHSWPNSSKILRISFIFSILASILIISIMYTTNNKIATEEDIKKYLDLSLLAVIPYNSNKNKG